MRLKTAAFLFGLLLAVAPAYGQIVNGGGSGGGGGTPGGSTTQCQYNNAGSFGGITGCTSNGSVVTLVAPVLGTPTSGNGSNLTALNATQLTSGAVPAARMPALTGDITTSAGAIATTLATVNSNVGTFGDTTHCANFTVNGKGLITAAAQSTSCPGGGGGSVSVTSASANIVVDPTPGTGTFTVGATFLVNPQTGTSYTIVAGDAGKLVTFSNSSSIAVTLPQATGSFASGWSTTVENLGSGTATITPTTSTINGASTLSMAANTGCDITSDLSGNYQISACTAKLPTGSGTVTSVALASASNVACVVSGSPVTTSGTLTCTPAGTSGGVPYFSSSSALGSSAALAANALVIGGGAGAAPATTTTGTGVITALGNNVSAAGGVTSTIAAGTSALGTSAISSATCATVVTTSATNTATTDVILAGFNGDPTAVTGYAPATAGMLTIISYPSANNVNFKVCNNSSSSITPGAVTLNWRVVR